MARIRYNLELLEFIIDKDNCKINLEYYKKEKLNRETRINFICNCGEEGNKTFRMLYENGGGFCKECTLKNTNFCKTNKYNLELLKFIVERDKSKIDLEFYKKEKVIGNSIIEFICNCGQIHMKKFYDIFKKGGSFCKECTKINKKEKTKNTNMKRRGVEYPYQSEEIKEKMRNTNMERRGVENPFQSKEIIKIIKEKIKITNMEKRGVENVMQCSEIAEKSLKSCYSTKDYILPSGKIIKIQGYEHFALNELILQENIDENDIITSRIEVPEIWYYNEGVNHRYYTDIYIKSQKKCIEVKSYYTSNLDKDILKLKENATIYLGYEYEIRIYDKKGKRI